MVIPSYYDAPTHEGSLSMRGDDQQTGYLFSYLSPEERVPADHPLRPIRQMTDAVLARLSPRFDRLYSDIGRPSIPPEQLLRALLLQALYTVRSERLLMEQLQYNLLFRWFVGLSMDDAVWTPTVFSKNRDRLLDGDIAQAFFLEVRAEAQAAGLLSDEHFTVDGTLLEAWASQKSFRPKDRPDPPADEPTGRNPTVNFRGEERANDTHQSTTDPDARLYKKASGQEAKLAYLGHLLTENRHGLIVDALVTPATGTAERDAAAAMIADLPDDRSRDGRRRQELRHERLRAPAPRDGRHPARGPVSRDGDRGSAIDARTTRHPGYAVSQRKRKLVEQCFGWMKTVGLMRKLRHRGGALVDWIFTFTAAAYNLVRMRTLLAQPA